jgi:hypothetical protein
MKNTGGIFVGRLKEPVVERIAQLARRYPSRSAAARAWGININTLKSYYRKDGPPPEPRENQLMRIAESEGVSLEWLRDGVGKTPGKSPKTTADGDRLSEMLEFLTAEERLELTTVLARKGVEVILYLLDEDNIRLMQLDAVVKEKILGQRSNAAREAALDSEQARECGSAEGSGQRLPHGLKDKKQAG